MSFLSNLSWRYATKQFDPTKKLSEEQIDTVLEAIRMAPTSFGAQPFYILRVRSRDIQNKFEIASYNQPQLSSASDVLVFAARNDLENVREEYFQALSGGDPTIRSQLSGFEDMMTGFCDRLVAQKSELAWSTQQAYIAQGFALAALAELEIDSCPMEGFDPRQIHDILSLPANLTPVLLLPIGYRSESETPRAKFRKAKGEMISSIIE